MSITIAHSVPEVLQYKLLLSLRRRRPYLRCEHRTFNLQPTHISFENCNAQQPALLRTLILMIKTISLSFGLILLAIASKAEAQCPIDRSLSLCCRSLENFSSNSYVWENICGFHDPVDPTTLVAGGCFTTSTCLNGLYDACCERYLRKNSYHSLSSLSLHLLITFAILLQRAQQAPTVPLDSIVVVTSCTSVQHAPEGVHSEQTILIMKRTL
ncbi:hypothetical protein C8Q75DRAFT_293666 [Abortiporus biennis]|nr:hypothetical protein C8Q75DRAFT_293666 [Abortiporus biennis]